MKSCKSLVSQTCTSDIKEDGVVHVETGPQYIEHVETAEVALGFVEGQLPNKAWISLLSQQVRSEVRAELTNFSKWLAVHGTRVSETIPEYHGDAPTMYGKADFASSLVHPPGDSGYQMPHTIASLVQNQKQANVPAQSGEEGAKSSDAGESLSNVVHPPNESQQGGPPSSSISSPAVKVESLEGHQSIPEVPKIISEQGNDDQSKVDVDAPCKDKDDQRKESPRQDASARQGHHDVALAQGWCRQGSRLVWNPGKDSISFVTREVKMEFESLWHWADHFVRSGRFDRIATIFIILNGIMIGVQAQWLSVNTFDDPPQVFSVIETVFCVIFVFELALRIAVFKKEFIFSDSWTWNLFDSLVVSVAILEEIIKVGVDPEGGDESGSMSGVRVLRILRLIRLIRVVRALRFFRELRLMLTSIMNSLRPLTWAVLLLLFIIYVIAIYLTQMVNDKVRDEPELLHSKLTEYYGNVLLSSFTLYNAISGGDWALLAKPLIKEISPIFAVLYALYIAFWMLAVVNVVTSVFVETAISSAAQDKDIMIQEELEKQDSYVNEVRAMFHEADEDGSGLISWEEFESHLGDNRVQAYFKILDLDVSEAHGLFNLLDMDNTGHVSADEFCLGCLRLKGQAKSVDIASLMYENKRMVAKWSVFMRYVQGNFELLSNVLQVSSIPFPDMLSPVARQKTNMSELARQKTYMSDRSPG